MLLYFLGLWPGPSASLALASFGMFTGLGLLLLLLWVPGFDGDSYARQRIEDGYFMFGAAAVCLVLGPIAFGLGALALAIFLVKIIIRSVGIIREKD